MKTYDELRSICKLSGRVSERVVDDFLINYAAGHQGLEKKMGQQFDRFRHVGKQLGKEAVNMLKSQYLAHKVFKTEGLLGKFLKHPALGRFKGEERDYLEQAAKIPWRFTFSVIVDEPAADFYTMQDVFTGKKVQLYSPTISDIKETSNPTLWFNLIGFNGFCWQSYGPVVYYQSFEAGDIYFYATELNPDIEEPEEVMADVDLDPLPYMMLISGSTLPLNFNKEDQLLYLLSEFDLETLDTAQLKKAFRTEYESGVYRITLKKWGDHPHFAQAYFDEGKKLLLFSAMTHKGFLGLVKAFNAFGHAFEAEPFMRVNLSMQSTAAMILNKKVVLNEYIDMFQLETDPDTEKIVEDMNAFIALVLPEINAGNIPDIEEAARKTGVDPEVARSVVDSVMGRRDSNPDPMGNLPAQSAEVGRLLTRDDELLFNLHLYMMAGKIQREAPWEYLFEDEIFGVQVPGSDLVYFVSVMGSNGEFPALSFYKGYGGLADFMEFRAQLEDMSRLGLSSESMMLASIKPGGMMTISHLMLSFTDREMLGKEDRAAIKKSGAQFRGRGSWPQIEEIVPGYVPAYPEKESLVELYLVMQQVLVVLEKAAEDESYLLREDDPEDVYLVRIPTGKGPRFRWKDHYLLFDPLVGEATYPVIISTADRAALSRLPEAEQELQLDLFMLPTPVREKGHKAFFPFVLLLIDKLSDMVISSSVLSPKPDLSSLYESVPQKVIEELLKPGHRPSKIEIRSDLLWILLEETLEHAGCKAAWVNQMPEMDEVILSLISHTGKKLP
jgi:hypothetical protein